MPDSDLLIFPDLNDRIIDGKDSETYDQLYFVGTKNNYAKRTGKTSISTVSKLGNFWVNQNSVKSQFKDILDGGDSAPGTSQFSGPIIGGEFPIDKTALNT